MDMWAHPNRSVTTSTEVQYASIELHELILRELLLKLVHLIKQALIRIEIGLI